MDSTVDAVRGYYDENAQLEWDRLEKHPFEFIFTTGMMERYIRPGDSVLDIGGGPGRYSIHYAKMGCRVVLAELSSGNVALAREKAAEAGVAIETHVCDCLELERLDLGQFDHVFLMGPLYHLQREEDRVRAVEVALRHLKPGGMLPVFPFCISAIAASIAASPLLDFGASATRITASAKGMRASGRPTIMAASTAALTIGMICGHARPTSSHAQTISLRQADGRSPASSSRAR